MKHATRSSIRNHLVALFLLLSVAFPVTVNSAPRPKVSCEGLFSENVAPVPENKGLPSRLKSRSDYFNELKQSMDLIESNDRDLTFLEKSKEFIQLTKKLTLDQNAVLSKSDLDFLKNHPKAIPIQHGIALLSEVYASSVHLQKTVLSYWQLRPTGTRLETESKILNSVINPIEITLRGIGSLLNPFSFRQNRIDRIFEAQEDNPEASLSVSDEEALKRLHLLEGFEERKAFIQKHPHWTSFRRWVDRVANAVLASSILLVANHELHLSRNMVSSDHYQTQVVRSQSREQIDILVDIGAFTHLAVQMDGKVYSYGVRSMDVIPVAQYLRPVGESKYSSLNPRSVQVIRINMSAEERAQFKRDLEFSAYKYYDNKTFINDCATMIARSLRKTTTFQPPQMIDASPSQMGMYLSYLNTLGTRNSAGRPLVEGALQVGVEDPQRKVFHLLRNGYFNMVESSLFIKSIPFLQSRRIHLDITTDERKLQWWSPQAQQQFSELRKEQLALLNDDPQIQFIETLIAKAQTPSISHDDAENIALSTKKLADFYFSNEMEKAEAIQKSLETDINDAITAESRLEILKQKRDEINRALSALAH